MLIFPNGAEVLSDRDYLTKSHLDKAIVYFTPERSFDRSGSNCAYFHVFQDRALMSETPAAACVPAVGFLSGPVSLISSDTGGPIGGRPLMTTMFLAGGLVARPHHRQAACVSLMLNFCEKNFSGPLFMK